MMARKNNPVILTDKEIRALGDLFSVACSNAALYNATLQRAMDKIFKSQKYDPKKSKVK